MAVEQAVNAWQNAAYRLAGELVRAEAALRGGRGGDGGVAAEACIRNLHIR